ncbi:hypothetical protein ALC57_05424 [Trachymyrmex cornetzi]|uniref:Uncharacterized protein n=1 Tax=Trachymyrmex cornetzi TaxID=471704 RepID=A0A195EBI2_9HYME|nr:hypothetical protein ALC57_05424 [Trachymyrmex cornetzi]
MHFHKCTSFSREHRLHIAELANMHICVEFCGLSITGILTSWNISLCYINPLSLSPHPNCLFSGKNSTYGRTIFYCVDSSLMTFEAHTTLYPLSTPCNSHIMRLAMKARRESSSRFLLLCFMCGRLLILKPRILSHKKQIKNYRSHEDKRGLEIKPSTSYKDPMHPLRSSYLPDI